MALDHHNGFQDGQIKGLQNTMDRVEGKLDTVLEKGCPMGVARGRSLDRLWSFFWMAVVGFVGMTVLILVECR